MRRLRTALVLLALCLAAGRADAAYSVIAIDSVAGPTPSTLDSSGADLAVMVSSESGSTVVCSDSKSNSWTDLTTRGVTGVTHMCYSRLTSTGSGHSFATTGENFGVTSVVLLSGSVASPFDQESGSSGSSITTLQPGSLTPSQANCIVIVGYAVDTTGETINSGFTKAKTDIVGGVNYGGGIAYLIQTTATAVNPTLTLGSSGSASMAMAVFKAAAGGGGGGASGGSLLLLGVGQ